MRIIGGSHAGLRLHPPMNLPVRPTTDMAKEALFNILQHRIDFEGIHALDLFAGTGSITFELASRGAAGVTAVDIHFKCVQYINTVAEKLSLPSIKAIKADAMKFIPGCKSQFDLVFADPPYDLPQLRLISGKVFDSGILQTDGLLILEHPSTIKMPESPYFQETRKYGYSSFTFYKNV